MPDRVRDPLLWETVTKSMLHGHCDSQRPCYKAGQNLCDKRYPRPFQEETQLADDGYPTYCRRSMPERQVEKHVNGSLRTFSNQHVIPYNPYLTRKYNCHINVEITSGIRAIKYIYKYIYKGEDRAIAQIQQEGPRDLNAPVNEVDRYVNARYITAHHACWRIFSFHMHKHDPCIYRLPIHLPDQQFVVYGDVANLEDVARSMQRGRTMLTAA